MVSDNIRCLKYNSVESDTETNSPLINWLGGRS